MNTQINQDLMLRRKTRRDTRTELLDATGRILAQRNSIDVTFVEIAESSGINSALIKYHFGNKDGLLLALMKRDAEQSLAHLNRLVTASFSPVEKVRRHIRGIINAHTKHPYLNLLIHALMDNPNETLAEEVAHVFLKPLVSAQEKILQEGIHQGLFRPVDPLHFYYSIVGACDILFHARSSLKVVFDVKTLTPAIKNDYATYIADNALRSLGVHID